MRARLLKPGFFTNEDLAQLPVRARLLFAGLWCLADREGRLEDRPQRIKAAIFPYERINVEPLLAVLHSAGFVKRYTAVYTRCLALPTFAKYQQPHPRESPSLLPPPPRQPGKGAPKVRPCPVDPVPGSGRDQDQDQNPPGAARPVALPPFKVYCAIAKRIVDATPAADLGELAERMKTECARQGIHASGEIIRKAIDAVIHARRRRA